jgi:hypothetical protein
VGGPKKRQPSNSRSNTRTGNHFPDSANQRRTAEKLRAQSQLGQLSNQSNNITISFDSVKSRERSAESASQNAIANLNHQAIKLTIKEGDDSAIYSNSIPIEISNPYTRDVNSRNVAKKGYKTVSAAQQQPSQPKNENHHRI